MKFVGILVIGIAGIFCASTTWACELCIPVGPRDAFEQADLVLIVKRIAVKKLYENEKFSKADRNLGDSLQFDSELVKYKVIKIIKGTMPNSRMEFELYDYGILAECPYGFFIPDDNLYMIFLRVKHRRIAMDPFYEKGPSSELQFKYPCSADWLPVKENQVVLKDKRIPVEEIADYLSGNKKTKEVNK